MPTAAQESLRGLADELAVGVKNFYFANNFIWSVFAHRDGDVGCISHSHIVAYKQALAGNNVTFSGRNFDA